MYKAAAQPTVAWEEITPAIAQRMLDHVGHNRKERLRIVSRYAGDMTADAWRLTHQAIAFGVNGELLDGQHRLRAIVKSGKTVLMLVVRGIPKNACAVVDCGFARTVVDAAYFDGLEGVTNRIASTATSMCGGYQGRRHSSMSRIFLLDYIRTHEKAIFATIAMIPKRPKVSVASVCAVFARAQYHTFPIDAPLGRAAHVLINGEPPDDILSDGDKAMLALHRWLAGLRGGLNSAGVRTEIYGKTQRALYAYSINERVTKIYRARRIELFPVSTDQKEADEDGQGRLMA